MQKSNSPIALKQGNGYVIFDAVCIVVFIAFFLMCAYYDVTSGILFFFVCIIGSIYSFLDRKSRTIIIENRAVIEKRMLRKEKKIGFKEVKNIELAKGNNTGIVVVHANSGTRIKIPMYYQNYDLFEEVMLRQPWEVKFK